MPDAPDSADVIIVGGGTAGLLLAHQLSEDSHLRVHVFEVGKDQTNSAETSDVFQWPSHLGSDRSWTFQSVPQGEFGSRKTNQFAGKLLGGSSTINGGYYVAPSRAAVDAWTKLGNDSWTYGAVKQACLDMINVHPSDEKLCQENGLEISSTASGNGPVQVVPGLEGNPVTKAYFQALRDLGYPTTSAVFSDQSAVGQYCYYTQDPSSKVRSGADAAFGTPIKQRPNVTISLQTTVKRVILEGTAPNVTAKGVEVLTPSGESRTIRAAKEVILSAGAYNSPKLLELSGIGQPDLLQKHNIPVVLSSPYVGERLRTHVMAPLTVELNGNHEIPETSPGISATAFLASKDQPGLLEALESHAAQPGDDQRYDEQIKSIFLSPTEGSAYHFMRVVAPHIAAFGVILAVPFSQGTTHISSADAAAPPTVDPRFFSHPLDIEILSRHLKTAATFAARPALKPFFKFDEAGHPVGSATEIAAAGDLDGVKDYLRAKAMEVYHECGTCSMRPREDGGVVDQRLRVYDTTNLRVVDASVVPVICHGNTMAAVYAVAKRAADLIKEDLRSK